MYVLSFIQLKLTKLLVHRLQISFDSHFTIYISYLNINIHYTLHYYTKVKLFWFIYFFYRVSFLTSSSSHTQFIFHVEYIKLEIDNVTHGITFKNPLFLSFIYILCHCHKMCLLIQFGLAFFSLFFYHFYIVPIEIISCSFFFSFIMFIQTNDTLVSFIYSDWVQCVFFSNIQDSFEIT